MGLSEETTGLLFNIVDNHTTDPQLYALLINAASAKYFETSLRGPVHERRKEDEEMKRLKKFKVSKPNGLEALTRSKNPDTTFGAIAVGHTLSQIAEKEELMKKKQADTSKRIEERRIKENQRTHERMEAANRLHAMAKQNQDWRKEKVDFLKLSLAYLKKDAMEPYNSVRKLKKNEVIDEIQHHLSNSHR